MLHNYYTLLFIANDLQRTLKDARVRSVFSQNKNELVVDFEGGPALIVSCEPAANYLYLRSSFPRAKRNSVDFFPVLNGATVQACSIQPADREIGLHFSGNHHLLIQLFGSRANVLLTNEIRKASASFLHPGDLKNDIVPTMPEKRALPETPDELHSRLHTVGHLSAFSVLKKIYPLFGAVIVRELLTRARIPEEATVAEISEERSATLFETGREMENELRNHAKPRIYTQDSSPTAFAIIRLSHLTDCEAREFESIHEAIRVFLGSTFSRKSLLLEKDAVLNGLYKEKDQIERTLAKMDREAEGIDRSALYELYGKVVLAHTADLHKGMTTASLPNLFSPKKEPLDIPLDPHLTPAKNAQRYFDKAKKARHQREEQAGRRQEYHERYDRIQELLNRAVPIQTREQWIDFVHAQADELEALGIVRAKSAKREDRVLFRTFVVEGGFQVWAGKNSANNDLLTMKHARSHDLWFHARGGSGSHVLLRVGTGKGDISKRAIHQAASIAAFYSKLKNSKLVPVAMTERKYVRKPKGSPVGTVTIEREKVLMVEPRLPEKGESG